MLYIFREFAWVRVHKSTKFNQNNLKIFNVFIYFDCPHFERINLNPVHVRKRSHIERIHPPSTIEKFKSDTNQRTCHFASVSTKTPDTDTAFRSQ